MSLGGYRGSLRMKSSTAENFAILRSRFGHITNFI